MYFQNLPYEPDLPKVIYSDNILSFSGKAVPTDADMAWFPIIKDLERYSMTDNPLIVNFRFDYYNTASARYLTSIFKILDRMNLKNHNVKINWYYADIDETMQELGEMYSEMIKSKVNLIQYKYDK
jgi:hypothetical protein